MTKNLQHIQEDGYIASEHGAARDFNPHRSGSAEWLAWDNGWLEAERSYQHGMRAGNPVDNAVESILFVIWVAIVGGVGYGIYKASVWFYYYVMSL